MKIFGWKSAGRGSLRPVQTRVPLERPYWVRGVSGAALGTWPSNYEAQLREGYLHNAIAQRAVRLVAEGVASASLTASDPAALAMVKETSGGQGLLETVASHMLLHGNAYIELIAGPDGAPVELYALRPERVAIEADSRGWPMAFLYKAGEVTTRLPAESVIHIRNMHPLDDHYGLGCLGAASGAVAIHNAAAKWNKALLDNAARPSGALTYEAGDTGALSTEQFDRLRAELDAGFAGAMNAGRPMLLEGGLKWQALSLSPADMDFVGLKEGAAREIALAFGVPPMLMGLPGDATYANYREANKALWRQAILPLAGKILDALCQGLRPWFADLSMSVDLDHVPALSEDRERLWAQVGAADFLSVDEKRAAAGFAPLKSDAPLVAKDEKNKEGILELKFNPWHDTQDGKFTRANQGNYAGGGGRLGGGGASGTWPKAKPGKSKPNGGRVGSGDASGTWKPTKLKPSGGSFGGGGASGSWDKPIVIGEGGSFGGAGASGSWDETKPKKPSLKPLAQKREVIKPMRFGVGGAALRPSTRKPTIMAGGYNFERDSLNRSGRSHGELRLQPDQPRSRRAQREAGKPDRQTSDHGGHFIAREFGGPEIAMNHFAQDAKINRSEYRKLENTWKNDLKKGRKVTVDIVPIYEGSSRRPNSLSVTYFVNGIRKHKTISNRKGGK